MRIQLNKDELPPRIQALISDDIELSISVDLDRVEKILTSIRHKFQNGDIEQVEIDVYGGLANLGISPKEIQQRAKGYA